MARCTRRVAVMELRSASDVLWLLLILSQIVDTLPNFVQTIGEVLDFDLVCETCPWGW